MNTLLVKKRMNAAPVAAAPVATAVLLLSMVPQLVAQENEPRRPPHPQQDRFFDGGSSRSRGDWGHDRGSATTQPTEEEVAEFMKTHSPKRWERFSRVPDEYQDKIRRYMGARYLQMQRMQREDPVLYEIVIKRLPIEDEIFALGWELTRGSAAARSEIKGKLSEQVRALLTNRLEERRVRLVQWQERLNREEARLKDEEQKLDQAVEATVSAIENEQRWPLMGELPGSDRRRGPGKSSDRPTTGPSDEK